MKFCKYRSYNLASLSNLKVIGNKPGIHSSTRCSHSGAESISQIIQQLEVITTLHSTTA